MGHMIREILDRYALDFYFPSIQVTDVIEVLILTFLIYQIIVWIKNTKAWMLLRGIIGHPKRKIGCAARVRSDDKKCNMIKYAVFMHKYAAWICRLR